MPHCFTYRAARLLVRITALCTALAACADDGAGTGTPNGDADATGALCAALDCGAGQCDDVAGTCLCPSGTWFDGAACAPVEDCEAGACDPCPIPRAPTLSTLASSELLAFDAGGAEVEVGLTLDLSAGTADAWTRGAVVDLAGLEGERVRVFARALGCDIAFNALYDVHAAYPPAAGEPGSTAVALDDAAIVGWASSVIDITFGAEVDEAWRNADHALGPAEGTSVDVVSLGRGGHIVLGFDAPFADAAGPDLAVFENSFAPNFLELGRVSVSSDGETFVAFDVASTADAPVAAFGATDPSTLGQLAGRYAQGWGTPFDLATLRQRREVRAGQLDLTQVRYVRVDDVVGDGSETDSFGRVIYDPYPTVESAGFDLDAVAVLHTADGR